MDVHFDGVTYYNYNPDSGDELMGEASFEHGNYKIQIELRTSQNEMPSLGNIHINKKYLCKYSIRGKRHRMTSYDTYMGYEEKELEKSILSAIEYCYNRHKRGRKVRFNWV